MKKAIFVLIAIFIISCTEKPKVEFSLTGTTNGIDNGTFLYLDSDNNIIDSVKVENNTFSLKTKLPKSPYKAVLRTKDFSQYRFLWLENVPMTFDASETDFRHANVTGSEPENLSQGLYQKTDTLPRSERLKLEMEFVKENPNSIVSASILSVYSTTWGKQKTKELFDRFPLENKTSRYGLKIAKYIELNKDPKVGERFVDFEMDDPKGNPKRLSELKDKTVLLEFWASWCGPCRQENPNLVRTYQEFEPKGFEVFAVSLDEKRDSWLNAIAKDSLNWEHVSDLAGSGNAAGLIYGVNGIPDNFLIDKDGTIIGRNLRGEQLNEKLTEILN